jgi:hypothetical protein
MHAGLKDRSDWPYLGFFLIELFTRGSTSVSRSECERLESASSSKSRVQVLFVSRLEPKGGRDRLFIAALLLWTKRLALRAGRSPLLEFDF